MKIVARAFLPHFMSHVPCLCSGDYPSALRYCFLVVGYLRLVHSDVPEHPLLGLQLYTLGDILTTQSGRAAEALHAYRLSHEVRVSF